MKRDGNCTNRLGNPLMHDMHRSTRGWDYSYNPARRFSFKTKASEEEKGMLADGGEIEIYKGGPL